MAAPHPPHGAALGGDGEGQPGPARLRLVEPTVALCESFLEGAAEFYAEGRPSSTYVPLLGYSLQDLRPSFARFVAELRALASGTSGRAGLAADRVLWLVDGSEYVGQASVRPQLATEFLFTYGGHIGYSIRPSRRRRGYGTRLLALALPVARQLGLRRVLVTCDADNEASRRIIERNGGRFECALPLPRHVLLLEGRDPARPVSKLRFWIDLGELPPALAGAPQQPDSRGGDWPAGWLGSG